MTDIIPIGVGRVSDDLMDGLRDFIKKCKRQKRRRGMRNVRTAVTIPVEGRSISQLHHAIRFARANGFDVWLETPDGKLIDSRAEGY